MKLLLTLIVLALAACGAQPPPVPVEEEKAPEVVYNGPDRSAGLPGPAKAKDWAPPAVQTWTMDNGITVWFIEQRTAPLISMELIFPNGAATDPARKAGLTSLMVDMLDEGAGQRSALQIGEHLQRLATGYGSMAGTDGVMLSMDLLADTLDDSLQVLADLVRRPKFPKAEFKRRKAQWLAGALAKEANQKTARSLVMRRVLFGKSYGGNAPSGVRATLEKITLRDVKRQFKALITPKGATLVVVGAIDKIKLAAKLKRHFGDWKGTPKPRKSALGKISPKGTIYLVDFPGASQAAITVARRIPGTLAEDRIPASVFNWTIGGAFTSRVNMNLREDKGITYGARSSFSRWQKAGIFSVGAQVKADSTRLGIDEILAELKGIGDKVANGGRPITKDEYTQAQNGLLLGFPGRFEQQSAITDQLGTLAFDGMPADWYNQWPKKVQAVSLEDAQKVATTYSDPTEFVIIIAGDRALIEPTLKSLKMPIKFYDAQANPL